MILWYTSHVLYPQSEQELPSCPNIALRHSVFVARCFKTWYCSCAHIWQNSNSRLKILGARKAERSVTYTTNPQTLGATGINLIARVIWRRGFRHHWCGDLIFNGPLNKFFRPLKDKVNECSRDHGQRTSSDVAQYPTITCQLHHLESPKTRLNLVTKCYISPVGKLAEEQNEDNNIV